MQCFCPVYSIGENVHKPGKSPYSDPPILLKQNLTLNIIRRAPDSAAMAQGVPHYDQIVKAHPRCRDVWEGEPRAQACSLSIAVSFARSMSLKTLDLGIQPLWTKARAIFGVAS